MGSHDDATTKASNTTTSLSPDTRQRREVLRKLKTAVVLCSCFLVAEVAGGLLSGSLAVLSDAAHLFADLASFAVAIAASHLAGLPATPKHTYGLKRTESLAALFSGASLAFICVGLAAGAVGRLVYPPEAPVDGGLMTCIAGIGVVVNVALAVVLGEDHVHLPGGSSCDHHGDHHGEHGDHSHSHEHGKDCHGHRDEEEDHDDAHEHPSHEEHHSCDSHSHDDHSHENHSHDDHSHENHSHEHAHEVAPQKDHHHCSGHHGHEDEAKNESSPLLVPQGDHDHGACEHSHHQHNDKPSHSHEERQRNINLHAAYLHVMGDLAQSLAVFLGGLVIWVKPEWHVIDPILTLVFSGLVLWSVTGVVKSSLGVLLEETPAGIDWQEVYDTIGAVPGVADVHDLHIWCISHGQPALSVHCTSSDDRAIPAINAALRRYGIKHTTIQVNRGGDCGTCPAETRDASNKTICDHLVQ